MSPHIRGIFYKWLLIPCVTVALAIAADRIRIEYRMSSMEAVNRDMVQRLDRIEDKLDKFIFGTSDAHK